jgi:hypothetical protein
MKNILKRFIDKAQAVRVVKQATKLNELVVMKANGEVNTFVPAKERDRRAKRRKMAKHSRRMNRK